MTLRLRPYNADDETAAVAIHESMLSGPFPFLLDWESMKSWSEFLKSNAEQRQGLNPSTYRVRGVQLGAFVHGELVGRASLRFELNEFFAERGGHVGYGVAPAHRRKGYATEILRQALIILRAEGVERVLVTCDNENVGSARVIEQNGGVFESIVPPAESDPIETRRYWIS
ncbi:MAG: GNAT family N-acetyltransferase [Acidimicrobiales bacterium]